MTDDIPALPDRIAAVYARGAGPWLEALYVLATALTPRWRLREHRPDGLTGCRICMRRKPRPTDATDSDIDQPDQLFVMPPPGTDLPFYTYCREHYEAYWARVLEIPT